MRKISIFLVLCLFVINLPFESYGLEKKPVLSDMYLSSFEAAGMNISENASFSIKTAVNENGTAFSYLEAIEVFGNITKVSALISFSDVDNGENIQWLDYTLPGGASTMASGGGTRNNVTASAYYYTKTITGVNTYRPYKLEAVSTRTTKFLAEYLIGGTAYNVSGNGSTVGIYGYSIEVNKSNPTANTVYSTSSTAPYYYAPTLGGGYHWIRITVGNGSASYIALPGSVSGGGLSI